MKFFAFLFIAAFMAPAAWAGNGSGSVLQRGVNSHWVSELQTYLHANKRADFYNEGPDGAFGPLTIAGLRSWQKVAGYPVTGRVSVGSRQWNQIRSEASVIRLPAGIDRRSIDGAKLSDWSIDANKSTNMLYLLHYDRSSRQVVVAVSTPTSFAGCNRDGCYETPEGACPVDHKRGPDEKSHEYNNAPMPYAVYVRVCGHGGLAVHFDPLGPSHGCIHVPDWNKMEYINRVIPLGALVVIHK